MSAPNLSLRVRSDVPVALAVAAAKALCHPFMTVGSDPSPMPRFHLLRPSLFTHRHKDTHR